MKQMNKPTIEMDPHILEALKTTAQVTLAVVGVVSGFTVAVTMPGLAQVLARYFAQKRRSEMHHIYIREKYDPLGKDSSKHGRRSKQALYYLRRQGYVNFDTSSRESIVELTNKGRQFLEKMKLRFAVPEVPKVWDKTWWIVLADIPTKTHRFAADQLRGQLKSAGFYPLQRTVWVHPFDPIKVLNDFTRYHDLGKFVTVMQVVKLDSDDLNRLKRHFGL